MQRTKMKKKSISSSKDIQYFEHSKLKMDLLNSTQSGFIDKMAQTKDDPNLIGNTKFKC